MVIRGKKFSVFCKNENLVALGPSFALFFTMITYLIVILTVIFFTFLIPYISWLIVQKKAEKITFEFFFTPGIRKDFLDP